MGFMKAIVIGVTVGWVYAGYRFYGTIDPRDQTDERLRDHAKNKK